MKKQTLSILLAVLFAYAPFSFPKDDLGGGGSLASMVEDFKLDVQIAEELKNEGDLERAFGSWNAIQDPVQKENLLRKLFEHHIAPQIAPKAIQ